MRYLVRGRQIRTENAAKTHHQASSRTIGAFTELAPHQRVLDYGCGKLRYLKSLAPLCKLLTLVDSAVQLNRPQRLFGRRTSVRAYVAIWWPHARVLDLNEFANDRQRYDFILCANVLSAIPSASIRLRVLRVLATRMARGGMCLVVNQHRNSDFSSAARRPTSLPHLGGYILSGSRGASYYAPLGRDQILPLLLRTGHRVIRAWVSGDSTFVLTGPATPH